MLDFIKIKDIISILPLLIIYLLPGYVFISIKDFIFNKKAVEDKNIIIKCIVISYIIINFEKIVFDIDISSAVSIIITFIISIIIAYVYAIVVNCNLTSMVLKKIGITTSLRKDTLTQVMDFSLGMWVRVFLNSDRVIYVGKIREFEQISENIYHIALSNFIMYSYDSGEELVNNADFNTEWVVISVKDNYRIELVYHPNSKKIID